MNEMLPVNGGNDDDKRFIKEVKFIEKKGHELLEQKNISDLHGVVKKYRTYKNLLYKRCDYIGAHLSILKRIRCVKG